MIILGYIGKHRKDDIAARAGWALVRLAQVRATYRRVTHVEAVLAGTAAACTIASASLRDKGVRIKTTDMTAGSWIAIDVPGWSSVATAEWFAEHSGERYDWRGALASVLWFLPHKAAQWFCNESIGAAVGLVDPHRLTPAAFMALAMSLPGSRDVTAEFFKPHQT